MTLTRCFQPKASYDYDTGQWNWRRGSVKSHVGGETFTVLPIPCFAGIRRTKTEMVEGKKKGNTPFPQTCIPTKSVGFV